MLKFSDVTHVGKDMLTLRRVALASAAAIGLYTFGGGMASYLTTATRLVSDSVTDRIPVEFELERARTMIGEMIPDIKENMIVIAQEEVAVENLRDEIVKRQAQLDQEQEQIMALRDNYENPVGTVRVGTRFAGPEEIHEELKRRFDRYQTAEATKRAKDQLLAGRESSLAAARSKLDGMLNARRDLEVDVENLEARLHTVQAEAVSSRVEFDDTALARCNKLVSDLRVRLQVAERLLSANGNFDDLPPSTLTMDDEDLVAEIDSYFMNKRHGTKLAKNEP